MTIWLPRWPVQRRLLERPELRKVPVLVCRPRRRGVMTVVSWAWVAPPRERQVEAARWRRSAGSTSASSGSTSASSGSTSASSGSTSASPRIPEGMPLAEAMAVLAIAHGSRACRIAAVEDDDPLADRLALEQLARYCRRFAPGVAIDTVSAAGAVDEPARSDCLHLDVTGTAGFFGGEPPLARTVAWTLAARGVHARVAIADTPSAAWAAARHTDSLGDAPRPPAGGRGTFPRRHRRWTVVPAGEQLRFLASLPAASLRIDAAVVAQLAEVGIDTIGGVARLPRGSLASRFDPHVSRRLAQFAGTVAEPLAPASGDELPAASQTFDFPLLLRDATGDELLAIVAGLVRECAAPLAARGQGILALQVRLERGRAAAGDEPQAPVVIDVGVFQPASSAAHFVELVRLRMARLRLPREIDGVAVEVVSAGSAVCRQRTLFGEAAEVSATEVAMLLDRLSGRLGRSAVFAPVPVADAQPEHAWAAVPPVRGAAVSPGRDSASRSRSGVGASLPADRPLARPQRRPICLLPQPVRLETVSIVDGESVAPPARFRRGTQVHEVVRAHGPERIETAWWRGPIVRRDYYEVETRSGDRYWIFRRPGRGPTAGQWFLHGTFS